MFTLEQMLDLDLDCCVSVRECCSRQDVMNTYLVGALNVKQMQTKFWADVILQMQRWADRIAVVLDVKVCTM